jgi:hypothetical protein
MNRVEEFLQIMLAASEARKEAALRVLRGETPDPTPAPPPPEPYLTLKELAGRLHVSTDSLWLWKVPGHDLGGRRRFKLSEVAAYLESEDFKRRAAALRAERKLSAKGASKRPTPTTAKP